MKNLNNQMPILFVVFLGILAAGICGSIMGAFTIWFGWAGDWEPLDMGYRKVILLSNWIILTPVFIHLIGSENKGQ